MVAEEFSADKSRVTARILLAVHAAWPATGRLEGRPHSLPVCQQPAPGPSPVRAQIKSRFRTPPGRHARYGGSGHMPSDFEPNWPAHNAAFAVTPAEAGSAFVR